ncbi:hypothetical protein [Sphingomonas sp. AX6]|uniref:hypothetical protein n=1 Tax=Sphingomonas sp. AX6 TaxID=2653171 RepID=UPI0012F1C70A|nr:hypothetical protein [Sphingomonas sp. AX6]VXC62801.1 hypothetical protein SPHINGOAX6_30180 [Sphingomonas sp. AX6]
MIRFGRDMEAIFTRLTLGAALGLVATMAAQSLTVLPAASVASPLPGDTHPTADSVQGALSASIEVR